MDLRVVLQSPAPPGGATFQTSSDNPSVVAAGDRQQGFLPRVFIPEGQTQSNPFTIFGISVGQTLLRLTGLTGVFGTSTTPTGAWDVNKPGDQKFVDANPPLNHCRVNDTSNDLSTDPAVLATCGVTLRGGGLFGGIAADGVSELLMRTISGLPGKACYEITSSSSFDQGALQTQVVDTQTVGSRQYGFTFYKAPDLFGDTADSRTLEIEFTFTPSIGNGNTTRFRAQTKIVRPPVVLLHGVWSKGGAWGSAFIKNDTFYTTVSGDYQATNGRSFATNVPLVQTFVRSVLDSHRAKGIAATQADVIAHSMGGNLTRLYIGSPQFMRPDNFGKGDIRRLLTLDTPHSGSTFPNLVVTLHRFLPDDTDKAVKSITEYTPAGGAACDLAENSPGLQGLNGVTTIPAQAITGTGGPAGSDATPAPFWGGYMTYGNIEKALTDTRCIHRTAWVCDQTESIFPQAIVDRFRFRQANDTIVALSDQQGGLPGINFANVIHSGGWIVNSVMNTTAVATQAYQLLDGPVTGFVATGFPGVGSTGTGIPTTVPGRGSGLDQVDYTDQCGPGGGLTVPAPGPTNGLRAPSTATAADSRVQITSPANGQTFAPGATIHLVVQITPPLVANDIAVSIPGFSSLAGTNYDGSKYEATFVIPDLFSGPLKFTPEITDTNNVPISGVGVTLGAVPAGPPLGIALQQKNYRISLPTIHPSESLAVVGTYPGPLSYDLTSSITGTTYQSTDTAVVTISSEGVYQVVGPGIAVIKVLNSGLTDFAVFVVEDSASPLPPLDVTAQLAIKGGGFRLDRRSGFFVQEVVVASQANVPVPGPLFLVVSGLPAGVNFVNESGVTENILPGHPFKTLAMSPDGLNIQPGGSQTLILRFLDPGRIGIGYSSTVHFASGTP